MAYNNIPYIPNEDIRRQADEFRNKINPGGEIPLDILYIAEFDLDIELRPIALRQMGIDALILSDFKTLLIDNDHFEAEKMQPRVRFSVAHEFGHYNLHRDLINNFIPESLDDYVAKIKEIPPDDYARVEFQASEFAGRLMVPYDILAEEVEKLRGMITEAQEQMPGISNRELASWIAPNINFDFGVSDEVIAKRIYYENLI